MRSIGTASVSDATPRGVEWHWVSRGEGRRTERACADAMRLPFAAGRLPPEGRCGAQTAAGAPLRLPDGILLPTVHACDPVIPVWSCSILPVAHQSADGAGVQA